MAKTKIITGSDLTKQLSQWLSHGPDGEPQLTYESRLRWLSIEHPGWHVSAGQIITLDTGALATHNTPDNGERQVGRLTSYIVSGYVMDNHGNIIATGFSDEYRAYDWDTSQNEANSSWAHVHARQAIIRALEYIGISAEQLSMILKHGIDAIAVDDDDEPIDVHTSNPVPTVGADDLPPLTQDVLAGNIPESMAPPQTSQTPKAGPLLSPIRSDNITPTPPVSSLPPITSMSAPAVMDSPAPIKPQLPTVTPPTSTPASTSNARMGGPMANRVQPHEIMSASWTTMNLLYSMWTTLYGINKSVSKESFDEYIKPYSPNGSAGISIPDPQWESTPPETKRSCLDIAKNICLQLNRDFDALGL